MKQLHWRALTATVLGVVTTVGVAWAAAVWVPHSELILNEDMPWCSIELGGEGTLTLFSYERGGMVRRGWSSDFVTPYVGPEHRAREHGDQVNMGAWGRLPAAAAAVIRSNGEDWSEGLEGVEDARGWPMLALWCSLNAGSWRWQVSGVSGGILLSKKGASVADARALPLRPIWKGLAVNTAVFGACWWTLLTALVTAQRLRRKRRNECVRCGYDVAGQREAGCPECGWGREPEGLNRA